MAGLLSSFRWPEAAIMIPWDIWLVTWLAAAFWSGRTIKTPRLDRELAHRAVLLTGFVCLLVVRGQDSGDFWKGLRASQPLLQRYWALPANVGWVMVGLVTLGSLVAWWSRVHLSRFWSWRVTSKEGHCVIDTGPYALVRHPIYTGILLAAFATAAEKGTPAAAIGALLCCYGYWLKARLEENFLCEELDAGNYEAYRRKVPMFLPFGPNLS